jgi:hypothetical protein
MISKQEVTAMKVPFAKLTNHKSRCWPDKETLTPFLLFHFDSCDWTIVRQRVEV